MPTSATANDLNYTIFFLYCRMVVAIAAEFLNTFLRQIAQLCIVVFFFFKFFYSIRSLTPDMRHQATKGLFQVVELVEEL